MKKKAREQIRQMFDGRCAYCGCGLPESGWHIDHVEPIFRNWGDKHPLPEHAGSDTIENMVPACKRCNLWKKTMTVEQFRSEIAAQVERLLKYSAPYRLATDYGIVAATSQPVQFYFEKI